MAQTMSMRISDEIQELFKNSANESGLKHEEFLAKLLSVYAQHGYGKEEVKITQEKAQVRAGLDRIRVLIEAVIDRAGDQSKQAEDSIKEKEKEFSQKFVEFKEEIQRKKDTINALTTENKRLSENAESRKILREAYEEKEKSAKLEIESLQSKLNILKSVVDEKEQLKKELAECKDKMRVMELDFEKRVSKIMEEEKNKMQAFVLSYSDKIQSPKKSEKK